MGIEALGFFIFALGVFVLYVSFQFSIDQNYFYVVFPISILLISLGTYIIYINVPISLIFRKFFGFILAVIGYWFIFRFPDAKELQFPTYTIIGILIGIISLSWGLYLLFF